MRPAGARRIILASPDPRALRAYLGLGLELQPAAAAAGVPRGARAPAEVRPGGPDDAPLMAEVDHWCAVPPTAPTWTS